MALPRPGLFGVGGIGITLPCDDVAIRPSPSTIVHSVYSLEHPDIPVICLFTAPFLNRP